MKKEEEGKGDSEGRRKSRKGKKRQSKKAEGLRHSEKPLRNEGKYGNMPKQGKEEKA